MNTNITHEEAIDEVATNLGKDLAEEAKKWLAMLTESEIESFSQGMPYRLAKTLLVAISKTDRIERQWSAETITPNVKRVLRIRKTRCF